MMLPTDDLLVCRKFQFSAICDYYPKNMIWLEVELQTVCVNKEKKIQQGCW